MNLKFKTIREAGVLEKERLVARVTAPDDIGRFLVCQVETSENNTGITNYVRRCFWCPDQKVKAGDLMVLYTKVGNNKSKKNSNGSTTHFFYWDLKKPVWHEVNSAVVIVESKDWEYEVLMGSDDIDENI